MATPVIDYLLDRPTVSNPDGSLSISFPAANIETFGSPLTIQGNTYYGCIDLSSSPRGSSVDISGVSSLNKNRFHVRVVFWTPAILSGQQNLVDSDRLPFSLSLRATTTGLIQLVSSVQSTTVGWQEATTGLADLTPLHSSPFVTPGEWHVADLVYDTDTLGHFLDGVPVGIHGFGDRGDITLADAGSLAIGGSTGALAFKGQLAAVRVDAGIPVELEALLDQKRVTAQWYITTKLENLRPTKNLGEPSGSATYSTSTNSWRQDYHSGTIMFSAEATSAFAIYGAFLNCYNSLPSSVRDEALGFLVSDVVPAEDGRRLKSSFSKGAILQSPRSPEEAFQVTGRIYVNYEITGGPAGTGYPLEPPQTIIRGVSQRMERATWFWKNSAPTAHFVMGAILQHFLATGSTDAWGFPISDEESIKDKDSGAEIGRASNFEQATIFWSSTTGACVVQGDLRTKYMEVGGPTSYLGFPISDPRPIPGAAGNLYNAFQGGFICWFGGPDKMAIATPFTFFLDTIDTEEDEGPFSGQNDLYINISMREGASHYFFNQREPSDGTFDGGDFVTVHGTYGGVITPTEGAVFTLVIDVWDSDDLSGDDKLGTWSKTLDITNAWGFAENGGIIDSGAVDKIKNIRISLKPAVDISGLEEYQKYWGWLLPDGSGGGDFGTDWITRPQFADAFDGVDPDPEYWDVLDGYDTLFYNAAVSTLGRNGDCYGLALETLYARVSRSPFSLPLDRFTDWPVGEPTIVLKHQYQVGAQSIWYFLGHIYDGSTHNPRDVFNSTQECWNQGNYALIHFFQNSSLTSHGVVHTVIPVAWDTTSDPWTITVLDPNYVGKDRQPRKISVWSGLTPGTDMWYEYEFSSAIKFSGGRWGGSRMTYTPMSIIGTRPRVPTWDVIPLILSGVIAVFGDSLQSAAITAADGSDLNATGETATAILQAGGSIEGYFSPVPTLSAPGSATTSSPASILVSYGKPSSRTPARILPPGQHPPGNADTPPPSPFDPLSGTEKGQPDPTFVHTVTGTGSKNPLTYLLKSGLTSLSLSSDQPLSAGEALTISGHTIPTSSNTYTITLPHPRAVTFTVTAALGLPTAAGSAAARSKRNEATTVQLDLKTLKPGVVRIMARPGAGMLDVFPSNDALIGGAGVKVTVRGARRREQAFQLHGDGAKTAGGVRIKICRRLVGERVTVGYLVPGTDGREIARVEEEVVVTP